MQTTPVRPTQQQCRHTHRTQGKKGVRRFATGLPCSHLQLTPSPWLPHTCRCLRSQQVQEVKDSASHDVEQHQPPGRRVWATRTARNSYIGMFMIGFAMALDFTASLMSIQPLYYITGLVSQALR
jgi:hypothetical protein